jgi:hypothetical protein
MEHISNILPTVLENKELLTQESTKPVTGDEKSLQVAIQSKLIKACQFEELKEVLRFVMIKVGLRAQNWPNDLEKLVLFEHILQNFGGNRIEEIKLAFDMAIAGKLETEVNCYENFSCYYFSTIMNAYRKWSSQAIAHAVKQEPPPQKIFSQEELDNSAREDAERQYQLFLKGHELKGLNLNEPILRKDGLLNDEERTKEFFTRRALAGSLNIYTHE